MCDTEFGTDRVVWSKHLKQMHASAGPAGLERGQGLWAHNNQAQIFNYGSDYNKYVYECRRHLDEFPSLRLGVRGL